MIYPPVKVIIWDWNGTLLNDVDICVAAMNHLLIHRKLPMLDHRRYTEIFTFPVQDYYQAAGFDFTTEPFEIPAMEFIEHYFKLMPEAELVDGTIEILEFIKSKNTKLLVLSAMQQQSLEDSISHFGISSYFELLSGTNDHYARGKAEQGKTLISQLHAHPREVLMIGDTLHDFEVAQQMNCQCILVAHGHQSKERLSQVTKHVVESFSELRGVLSNILFPF
jgi:phosphoglycolate phosphatase